MSEIKARIANIEILIQEGLSFDKANEEFSDAIEWISHYWETKNFLPSFGDNISDNTGGCYIVTGKAFFINDYETVEICVMKELEFLQSIFKL